MKLRKLRKLKESRTLRNNKKKKMIRNYLFGLIIALLLLYFGGVMVLQNVATSKDFIEVNENKALNVENVSVDTSVTISSVGNIIFHDKQIVGAKTDGGYDFTPSFKYIKDIVNSSDISIGAVETTFLGENFRGFPRFISPDEALYAIKDMGIDVINYASNHILDSGSEGVKRTIEVTKQADLSYSGIRETTSDKKYIIEEVKGHKIGTIAYVFETPMQSNGRAINSILIPNDLKDTINTFNYGELDSFYTDVNNSISEMKENGAEFIILQVHWGEEYDTFASKAQKEMAKELSELDVDIIMGSHPHVIQPYETIVNSKGKKVFVSYSQGNFLSNQNYEELGDARTEDGTIINFKLDLDDNKKLYLKSYEIIPTWVHRTMNDSGTYNHTVIPVEAALADLNKFSISKNEKDRLERSLNSTKKILGVNEFGLKDF